MRLSKTSRAVKAAHLLIPAYLLCGCATGTESPLASAQRAAERFMASMTVLPKFTAAVKRGDLQAAEQLYAAQPDLLSKEAPNEVSQAASALNAQWSPRLAAATSAIEESFKPEGFTTDAFTAAMRTGRDELEKYDSYAILKPRRSADSEALRQSLAQISLRFAASFEVIFARYDHVARPLLLENLPVEVPSDTRSSGVLAGFDALARSLQQSPANKAADLLRAYSPVLPVAKANVLRSAYRAKVANEMFGLQPDKLKPSQMLALASRDPSYGTIKFARLDAAQASARVSVDGKAVDEVIARSELMDIAKLPAERAGELLIVVDGSVAGTITEIKPAPNGSRKIQAGSRQVPNEDYVAAAAKVRKLERDLRESEQQNVELQRQSQALSLQSGGKGSGAAIAALGSAFGTAALSSLRDDLAKAQRELDSTPRTKEQPIYLSVPVRQFFLESKTLAQPIIYLVDVATARLYWGSRQVATVSQETVPTETARRVDLAAEGAPQPIALSLSDVQAALDVHSSAPQGGIAQVEAATSADREAHSRVLADAREAAQQRSRTSLAPKEESPNKSDSSTSVATAPSGVTTRQQGGCQSDLAYLDAKLPRFSPPMLKSIRDHAVGVNVLDVIQKAKAQGNSAESAVDQMLRSARSMDAQVAAAGQCASVFDALGSSDEAFIEGIKSGELASISNCDGIRNSCLCAGLVAKLGAYVTRATAAAMQCHAKTGAW